MIQTAAIFKDAYRELNARKLFWITLIISVLVVGAFACFGINSEGITIFIWTLRLPFNTTEFITPAEFYKNLFETYGIGVWLSWIATILALISTGGIFPDFISSGSIELTLSKPIGRLRLFFLKYLAATLFVVIQVAVFVVGAFLVIGIRGKEWEPRLFLAIPIVVCVFTYLFSICVLLGLLTRSTMASILLTLLIWFFIFLLNVGDGITLQGTTANEYRVERAAARVASLEETATAKWKEGVLPNPPGVGTPTPADLDNAEPGLAVARKELADIKAEGEDWKFAGRIATITKTFFPKTGETVALLGRTLKTQEQLDKEKKQAQNLPLAGRMGNPREQKEIELRMEEKLRGRTLTWVLGTSLVFEAFVLAIAAFIFRRRDF